MQLYYDLEQMPPLPSAPVVSVGNFDGVHLGHQTLMSTLAARANALNCPALALTFHPHPLSLLRPDKQLNMIYSLEQRALLLSRFGAQIILCLRFDQDLAGMSAEDFIRSILVDKLKARELVEGFNFNFGKNGQGNVEFLRQMSHKYNYVVHQVEPVIIDGAPVSSSRVRKAISTGQMELAARLLGRPYQISGTVIHGQRRGAHLLGMPTANLAIEPYQLLPPQGVYAARVQLENGQQKDALFNLGINPTFGPLPEARLEAHLLDFSGNLYGQHLWVRPWRFLREERKFSTTAELKEQMTQDLEQARQALKIKGEL